MRKPLSENAKNIEQYANRNDLEIIFSEGHHLYDKIFYDSAEGKYYNRETDFFLTENELGAFGLGPSPARGITFEFFNKCASL